jgi:DNA-binding PadR family transcriptional regulator
MERGGRRGFLGGLDPDLTANSTQRTIDPMRSAKQATTLEYALLALLDQEPHSGYELRRIFTLTPLGYFSDSPGAIYPALRRLVARHWVGAGAPQGGRRLQEYRISARGREALVAWLRLPVTGADVVSDPDALMLRFAFMGQALPVAAIRGFLREYERRMTSQLEDLRRHHGAHMHTWSLTGRLAFEHGLAQHETRVAWARSAARTLEKTKEKS